MDWDQLLKRDPAMAPIKISLKSTNFDKEYFDLAPKLSMIKDRTDEVYDDR